MTLRLSDSVSLLAGVGPTRTNQLAKLGIESIRDLLSYAPFRYEQVEREITIGEIIPEQTVCIHAQVLSKFPIRSSRFRNMLKVTVADRSGKLDLMWFNSTFMLSMLTVGEWYFFTGKASLFKNHLNISNPTVETKEPLYGSLVPIYHESADINSRFLRKLIRTALESVDIEDTPEMEQIYKQHKLISLREALKTLHQVGVQIAPDECSDDEALKIAKRRLAFDEMFYLIRDVIARKRDHQVSTPLARLRTTDRDCTAFFSLLPFTPSQSQETAIRAIAQDLGKPSPMHRLVQGEVGSGKTIVAAFALWTTAKAGHKAILICPTNILANQHYETLTRLFRPQTIDDGLQKNTKRSVDYSLSSVVSPSVGLFTGKEKNIDADILVGTHALFNVKAFGSASDKVPALVIIDEEHRFGVEQRESFFRHSKRPHFLSMTATPIPRTVALTALADRDISLITPHKSNTNIKTWVIPGEKRNSASEWIRKTLQDSREQALIVCPFIEESLVDTLSTVKSAKKEFSELKKNLPGLRLGLLHGQLRAEEKDALFAKMISGELDILVTTPVVEVGVDIPKASIIVIEGAERYGLAQLHQLRGRVGRRGQDAYCLLFTTDSEETATSRLHFFAKTYDGNALAEFDLKARGSGDLLGVRQHGFDALRFASWSDTKLIVECKAAAESLLS